MVRGEKFAFGEYLRVIFKRKALMVSVFLIMASGLGIAIFLKTPQYEVSGKLLVTRSRGDLLLTPTATGSGNFGFVLPQQQDLTAEAELLKSPSLIRAVVKKLSSHRQAQASAAEQPKMLASVFQLPESLTASIPAWLPPWLGGGSTGAEVTRDPNEPSPLHRAAASIRAGLTVQAIPNSNVIEVRYRATDPAQAVNVVNTLLKLYLDRYLEVRRTPGVTDFLTAQRDHYEQRLRTAEEAMRHFEGRTAIVHTGVQMEIYSRQLAEAEQKILKTRYDVLDKQEKLALNKAQMTSLPERLVTTKTIRHNPMIETLQVRLLELEMEREKLLQLYTEEDRRVRDIHDRIASLKQWLPAQREWVPGGETSQLHPLRTQLQESVFATQVSLARLKIDQQEAAETVDVIKQRIGEIARYAVDRESLIREVRANEEAYLLYRKKVEESRISEAMDQQKIMNVTIAEEASPPTAPLTRKHLAYAFALTVGLVAGVGSGFFREFLDDSIKTATDVESSAGLPVLASIPEENDRGKKNGGNGAQA